MTRQRTIYCLELLATLLSIFNATGTSTDNSQAHFELSPFARSGQIIKNFYQTVFKNNDNADLSSNANTLKASSKINFGLNQLNDKLFTTAHSSSLPFQDDPETTRNIDRIKATNSPLSPSLYPIHDGLPLATKYIENHTNDVNDNRLFSTNADQVKLKSRYVFTESRNSSSHFPFVRQINSHNYGHSRKVRSVSSVGKVSIQDLLRTRTQRPVRTRFTRHADVDEDLLEQNSFISDKKIQNLFPQQIDFGIHFSNNGLKMLIDDLAAAKIYKDDVLRILRDTSLASTTDTAYEVAPSVLDLNSYDEKVADDENTWAATNLDIDRSVRNIAETLLRLKGFADNDNKESIEESNVLTKRGNKYREGIYSMFRQGSSDSQRTPLQNIASCAREKDGSEPMRCPSSNTCLYDWMICDRTPHCPKGEDEVFTLCVLRHWTNKLMRKYFPAS